MLGVDVINASPPVGKGMSGDGGEFTVPSLKNGALFVRFSIRYGKGRTSYMPKPARMDVFPLAVGSQAIPKRGAKFLVLVLK